MLAIPETAYLEILTRTGLLDEVVSTLGSDDWVEKARAQCYLESFSATLAACTLFWDSIEKL